MQVKVKLFGALREAVGQGELGLQVADGTTAGQVWGRLLESYPALAGSAPAMAVNMEYVAADVVLREGDEVAFLPPVAGGGGR